MGDVPIRFPQEIQELLRSTIASAGGNEVFFYARVEWFRDGNAVVDEVEVAARGTSASVLAILERADGWDVAIHNHPSGRLEPSEPDTAIAYQLGNRGLGFVIISNDAERHYVVVPPLRERPEPVPLDLEEVRAIFEPSGPLAAALGEYEPREGQVAMALQVARALNGDQVLAAEAGTGVGKSFAYLVPAALWAVRNRKRVIVSTGTINLQEQLVGKDLPFLARTLPLKLRFALIKGRGNYACRRKTAEVAEDLKQPGLFEDAEAREVRELADWVEATETGDRSHLSWVPTAGAWEKVMSETDKSLKVACPFYSQCFYYEAKREASKADVLVVNHHLFFADLAVRRETGNYDFDLVIPKYQRVIFDEAHHLEDVATEYLGVKLSRAGILARLARLLSTRDHERGVVPALVRRLGRLGDPVAADSIRRAYVPAIIEGRERLEDLLDEAETVVRALPGPRRARAPRACEPAAAGEDPPGFQVRYEAGPRAEAGWEALSKVLSKVQLELGTLLKVNDRALRSLDTSRLPEDLVAAQSLELTSFGSRLKRLIQGIERFREYADSAQVRWVDLREARSRRERTRLELAAAPIRVAEALKDALYDPLKTVVLTSATLSVAGDVAFLGDRLGLSLLDPSRFRFEGYPSPFDYRRQALTVVPTDLPLPDARDFARAVPEAVFRIVEATRGRAFVLFTAYGLLRRTYAALEGRLQALGLRTMAQGEASRSELLDRFRSGTGNVLFGTDSFWEGVDVKGKALECVVITRLPFRVPTEPVQEARMEELEARGLNPFTTFTVPQAVLKLKQGFGRLIRSRTDRGIVAVLDRRVLTKPYGKVFLRSLPETELLAAPLAEAAARIEAFLAGEAAVAGEAETGDAAEAEAPDRRAAPATWEPAAPGDPPWDLSEEPPAVAEPAPEPEPWPAERVADDEAPPW